MSGGVSFALRIAPGHQPTPARTPALVRSPLACQLAERSAAWLWGSPQEQGSENPDPGRTAVPFHLVIYALLIEISFILDVLQN